MTSAEQLIKDIRDGMDIIDSDIRADRPPTGDDYNMLWDAVLDAIDHYRQQNP